MALTITKIMPTKNIGGRKLRLVKIVFDAAYVALTGYLITKAQLGLNKVEGASPMNLKGYQIAPEVTAAGLTLWSYKGNTASSDNEAGMDTLVGYMTVWGS